MAALEEEWAGKENGEAMKNREMQGSKKKPAVFMGVHHGRTYQLSGAAT